MPHKIFFTNRKHRKKDLLTASGDDASYLHSLEEICSDKPLDYYQEDFNTHQSPNHKSYQGKKKDYGVQSCESFGLPDHPIFSADLPKSEIDTTNVADPCDLCVVDVNYIDQPWLIEHHEVITPYCHVESLIPYSEVRHKIDPESYSSPRKDSEDDLKRLLTPTPLKSRTLNFIKETRRDVDLDVLKDQVSKVLDVIKEKYWAKGRTHLKNGYKRPSSSSYSRHLRSSKSPRLEDFPDVQLNCAAASSEEEEAPLLVEETGIRTGKKGRPRKVRRLSASVHSLREEERNNNGANNCTRDLPKLVVDESCLLLHSELDKSEKCPVLDSYQQLDLKKKVDISIDDVIKRFDQTCYQLGDFVWAQVGKYRFWPAVVCTEPGSSKFHEIVEKKKKSVYLYHIRFFGDNGKRTWIKSTYLLTYTSKYDLEVMYEIIKPLKSFSNQRVLALKPYLKGGKNLKWDTAVEEIETFSEKPRSETIEYLLWCARNNPHKKKPKPNQSIKVEPPETSHRKEDVQPLLEVTGKSEQDTTNRRRSLRLFKSVVKCDMLELQNKDLEKKQGFVEGNAPLTSSLEDCTTGEDSKLDEPEQKVLTPSESSLEPTSAITRRRSGRCLKMVEKLDMLQLRMKDKMTTRVKEEMEIKEEPKDIEDTIDKKLLQYSFEYQAELHKRNNLFNGLKNVRVCDYCFKPGLLFKCRGKCFCFFHMDCALKVGRPEEKMIKKSPKKKSLSPRRSSEARLTRSRCQIVTLKSKEEITTPQDLPQDIRELSIAEQIDFGMKAVMSKYNAVVYNADSSSENGSDNKLASDDEEESSPSVSNNTSFTDFKYIRHVTADSIILAETAIGQPSGPKCSYCADDKDPPCFICGTEVKVRADSSEVSIRLKCSQPRCSKYYHSHCLKLWPQTQWSIGKWSKIQQAPEDSFTCPAHRCHTCFAEELGSSTTCRLPGDKLVRCLLCPSAFHATTFCTPAGSEILGGSQIICPRHRLNMHPINTEWCFICSEGGDLICCDTCPTSVHPECQPINFTDDNKYICEDCESGRFPLYDEVVWVKLGHYRWWPALILFPNEVPDNVRGIRHRKGDFVVKFFGTNDYHWANKSRAFVFQEGDRESSQDERCKSKNKVYEFYGKAVDEAAVAYQLIKEFKERREAECVDNLKPPPFIKINKSKPVGNVKCVELNVSNATACECDPKKPNPCGPDSNCLNRLLLTECEQEVCSAGARCQNQAFQKRDYPPLAPCKTQGRGWGLKSLVPLKPGQFIIEYVGELIDNEEYQRRVRQMHEKREENYYFMTVDGDRMIDAGPKGNLSRFMNHSCNPNCITQKWTVKGDTRVGIFACRDIDAGSELTFNYNLEVIGPEKKVCQCGASNCSGFIGVKAAKLAEVVPESSRKSRRSATTKKTTEHAKPEVLPDCFACGKERADVTCHNKSCNKSYHLECLGLSVRPDASKYTCPRHNCMVCSHRTVRCCVKCLKSFCPAHSEGNVRYDSHLGFVCRLHDPVKVEVEECDEAVSGAIEDLSDDETSLLIRMSRMSKK